MTIAYDIATAAIAATIVGNEFAVAAFVHPQLMRLARQPHAQAVAPVLIAALLLLLTDHFLGNPASTVI